MGIAYVTASVCSVMQVQLVMLNILEVSTELQTLELQVSVSVLNVLSLRDPSHAATGC